MDTQGLFDMRIDQNIANIIGMLSFYLSSMQCFNVKNLIDSQHLEHIFVSMINYTQSVMLFKSSLL